VKNSRAPLIAAIVLLLLPVLYVGSYLALRNPRYAILVEVPARRPMKIVADYRFVGQQGRTFFWPLEQIDRQVRPKTWGPRKEVLGSPPVVRLTPVMP
jgi:hypothetical protein